MANPSLLGLDTPTVWDTERAFRHLSALGQADTKRTAERRLHELAIMPAELRWDSLEDEFGSKLIPSVLEWEIGQARSRRKRVFFAQLFQLPGATDCLHVNDARGARYWVPLKRRVAAAGDIAHALQILQEDIGKEIALFAHGRLVGMCRQALAHPDQVTVSLLSYPKTLKVPSERRIGTQSRIRPPHQKRLEAESIHILREAVAESDNPAMLYSMGKDSAVMLHLARKAFYPAPPPFPLLHVDTRWKFQEMYLFRDRMAQESGMDLLVHVNPDAIAKNINPFDHGSALHTDITKTEGLKQALDKYKFDLVFGGARRDEEKSRAKERIFSFRNAAHRWDPKNQRPEIWNLYNARKNRGEEIRVFPLSNWTEIDIWQYIYQENIPVVPLYFAKERPVVVRDGMMILVDDGRMQLRPGERIEVKKVRFRTLGCYPLTGAIESQAETLSDIILELIGARSSERQGRAIDADATASMEKKKQEGYF